jgi:glutathione synthase/RimK-type ligase-like ATP-grasp enzyme
MYDFVILTDDRYINPAKRDQYVQNILFEDGILIKELERLGFNVMRKSWSDPDFEWKSTKYAIFRTTWDYFDRLSEFINWLEGTSVKTKFINDYSLVKWNLDKHYLKDLKNSNVPIVPTNFIEPDDDIKLEVIFKQFNLDEIIIKPAISGAARHTYRVNKQNLKFQCKIFSDLHKNETWLIQPFLHTIISKGEISLIMINGNYSHSVLKIAKKGDFRVQDDFGGTVHDYQPGQNEIELAEKALKACPVLPVYARVDIVWDEMGSPLISELELIEPELFFRNREASARELALSISEKIN